MSRTSRYGRKRRLPLILPLALTLCLPLFAFADPAYVSAPDLAKANGMEYKDMSEGAVHAGKLTGNNREIVLVGELRSIVVNGASVPLASPVRWNGVTLEVPAEAVELILGKSAHPAATSPASQPVRLRPGAAKVVLDPGHGGKDPGTHGTLTGLEEKEVALEVALAVGARLEKQGVTVVYTRRRDVFVELEDRAALANRENPDLFLSIHVNADQRKELRGAMVLYPAAGSIGSHPGLMGRAEEAVESTEDRAREYRRDIPEFFGAGGAIGRTAMLALVSAAFENYRARSVEAAHCLQKSLAPVTGLVEHDNGVIEDFRSIHVLRETHCPAILCEMDFLSNRYSERKLATHSYRAAIADAISEGVLAFLAESSGERE